jgi:hypothetical protein
MNTNDLAPILFNLFKEVSTGVKEFAFIVNAGDAGLTGSLDKLSAEQASHASQGGATIAAHAAHLSYGFSLLNRWAVEGGNPYANARWQDAWKITTVDDDQWQGIRDGLKHEMLRWQEVLRDPRDVNEIELSGMLASIAHTAYHLGAIRQIEKDARGPKEGDGK